MIIYLPHDGQLHWHNEDAKYGDSFKASMGATKLSQHSIFIWGLSGRLLPAFYEEVFGWAAKEGFEYIVCDLPSGYKPSMAKKLLPTDLYYIELKESL